MGKQTITRTFEIFVNSPRGVSVSINTSFFRTTYLFAPYHYFMLSMPMQLNVVCTAYKELKAIFAHA